MPRSSGIYTPPSSSWYPAVNGVPATLTDWNNLLSDLGAAITGSIPVDGTAPLTGNMNANGNRITGLATATTTGDALSFGRDATLANLTFTGTGNRITGDFSNATAANRVMFQTSTVNGATYVASLPNGTSTVCYGAVFNSSDPANAGFYQWSVSSSEVKLAADKNGTGTYLPMTFYAGGAEGFRLDTNRNLGLGVAPNANWSATLKVIEFAGGSSLSAGSTGALNIATNLYNDGALKYSTTGFGARIQTNPAGGVYIQAYPSGTAGTAATVTCQFAVDYTGNAVLTTPNGGLGYGTGAGGTVTQATSKSTAVTLNKPTGYITMNNASLAASTTVTFVMNNSIVAAPDDVRVSVAGSAVDLSLYQVWTSGSTAGQTNVHVRNISAGALAEGIVLKFVVIKGATA